MKMMVKVNVIKILEEHEGGTWGIVEQCCITYPPIPS